MSNNDSVDNEIKVYRKSRDDLEELRDGLMIICPGKPTQETNGNKPFGEDFLFKYGAWGFVRLKYAPEYFGLYLSTPVKAVTYFGIVEDIIDPRKEEHPVDNFREYESYEEGDELIMLKRDKIIELNDLLPYEGNRIQGWRYTTLNQFIEAETTDDLWE